MHIPRKRFGQNFLEDGAVIESIVAAINPRPGERMVEIGPGLGALTAPLLRAVGRLEVVEIDRDIVRRLRARFPPDILSIHEGDALETDFGALGPGLRVAGNLPYNISTPILFHLTTFAAAVRDCHFMLQREVVQRMAAAPDTAEYGRLSVMLQYRWRIETLFDVPPTAFNPQPRVWSSIVRMSPHLTLPNEARDEHRLAEVVTAAFGQRRKTLRNALRALIGEQELVGLGVDPGARGETLDVAAFVRIANHLAGDRE
ncbi:MAG TPA: 16S rRNA (adenine(1518)-N(6)/adenine(1519)-N(6))-dimethyltransferase RsmA [Burkholderiales bacterium]